MDTAKLMELLNITDVNSIWIKNKKDKYIANNPFRLDRNSLYNSKGELRDDILARLIRGDLYVCSPCFINMEKYENYYFLNEKLEIKSRKNKENLIDYINIFMGNVFKSKEDITDSEIERLKSVIELIKKKRVLFTLKVDNDETFNRLRGVLEEQYSKYDICDDNDLRGTLQRASFL